MSVGLSKREQAVLSYLCKGLSDKEIALMLGISPRTVQKHLQHIYHYFDVRTRVQVIMRCRKLKSSDGDSSKY
jgi:DNA-binding CsgD family transcriptional regulator